MPCWERRQPGLQREPKAENRAEQARVAVLRKRQACWAPRPSAGFFSRTGIRAKLVKSGQTCCREDPHPGRVPARLFLVDLPVRFTADEDVFRTKRAKACFLIFGKQAQCGKQDSSRTAIGMTAELPRKCIQRGGTRDLDDGAVSRGREGREEDAQQR